MVDIAKATKKEGDKEFTFDSIVATSLLRGLAAAIVALSAAFTDEQVPPSKLCRAGFHAVATFLDLAAALGEKRRPTELSFHVDEIVAGLEGQLAKDADPVLSAWMVYNRYSQG